MFNRNNPDQNVGDQQVEINIINCGYPGNKNPYVLKRF